MTSTLLPTSDGADGRLAAAERRAQLVARDGVPQLGLLDTPTGLAALDAAAEKWADIADQHRAVTAELNEARARPTVVAAERADLAAAARAVVDGKPDPGTPATDELRQRTARLVRQRAVLAGAAQLAEAAYLAEWEAARGDLAGLAADALDAARSRLGAALDDVAVAVADLAHAERLHRFAESGPRDRSGPRPVLVTVDDQVRPVLDVLDLIRGRGEQVTGPRAGFLAEHVTKPATKRRTRRTADGDSVYVAAVDDLDDDD